MVRLDHFRKYALAFLAVSTFTFPSASVFAEDNTIDIEPAETINGSVELTPGYIAGVVDIGGQNISRIDLNATSTIHAAKLYPSAEGPYTMTVNVPAGGALGYDVSGVAWMDSWNTRMFFKDKSTVVAEGQTSKVDFIVDSGYVAADIVTNGCSLSSTELWALLDTDTAYSHATTKRGSESQFRFPVQPNNNIRVYGQTQLSTGKTISLTSQYVDIAPGQDTAVSWEINCVSGELSAIQHDVDYHMPIDYHYTYLYNQGSWSPYKTTKHDGSVFFDNLAPDTWRLYTYSYWNNYQNLIAKDMRDITTTSGKVTQVAIDEYPGFMKGNVTLEGTKTIHDTSYAHVYAYGRNSLYASNGVFSRALIDKADGNYTLALPYGEYSIYVSAFAFYNPVTDADYINSYLYMYDYTRNQTIHYIDPGQEINGHDLSYETGTAIIKFSRADGGTFTAPYLIANCRTYNESGHLDSYVYTNSRGHTNADKVTLVGFPGTYEVEAWAYVDGSLTTFGKVQVEIVSGVEKVVDIGGPALNVVDPVANSVVEESQMTVGGTATDESSVERITINGVDVPFVSTSNVDDLNEVSFSVEIELAEGENTIVTVAYDAAGNESSDTRTVTYTPPEEVVVGVKMDIKPGSCKNPLNIKSKGVLPVVLLGSSDFDVNGIDPDSLLLSGVAPVRSVVNDDAEFVTDGSCATDQADGYEDLVLKFDRRAIVAVLGEVQHRDVVTLTLTGTSFEGAEIMAEDTITIIKRGKRIRGQRGRRNNKK